MKNNIKNYNNDAVLPIQFQGLNQRSTHLKYIKSHQISNMILGNIVLAILMHHISGLENPIIALKTVITDFR